MIFSGTVNNLTISRFTDNGAYLADESGEEVLMPNRYLKEEMLIGDKLDVFVYNDSQDRLVAITDRPLAMAGEIAYLKVVDTSSFGAFVDWGLPKDLLIPKANQLRDLEIGKSYLVAVYRDMASGRVVGTTKLNRYIYNDDCELEEGDKVNIMIAVENEVGYRVIIDNQHWGVIYHDQIFKPVKVGDKMEGYVRRVTEDMRIDISIRREGLSLIQDSSSELLNLIKEAGGVLMVNDKTSPDEIYSKTCMSKKSFKRSVGMLLKSGAIEFVKGGIKLKNKENKQQ